MGWSQALGLFLAEAQIVTVTTQADVSEKISRNAMVNHKCPAVFLLMLQSQQPQCTPLSSDQIPSSLPCSDLQGMGKWAEEEERRRRQPLWPCPHTVVAVSVSGSSCPEKREARVPAHAGIWLMLPALPHAAFALFPCVCVWCCLWHLG